MSEIHEKNGKPTIHAKNQEFRVPSELTANPRNSRKHSSAQIKQIISSIEEFGWTVPLLIDEQDEIIAGHGRNEAAVKMGLEEVPVIVAKGWSDEQKRAYIIADNRLTENGEWDKEILGAELAFLVEAGFDATVTGFSDNDISKLVGAAAGKTGADYVPPVMEEYATNEGDIWVMGDHRLVCGSSLDMATLDALTQGVKADMVWTDPPYNVDYQGTAGKIQNDSMGDSEFLDFLTQAMENCFDAVKEGGAIYVAHSDTEGFNFRSAFLSAGFKLSGCLIWAKDSLVLGRSDYQWQHEPVLYGWRPGAAHTWNGDRKQTTILDAEATPFVANDDGSVTVKIAGQSYIVSGENMMIQEVKGSLIVCDKPARSPDHPTTKPVKLVAEMIENSTVLGEVVLDVFGGSGSTLIACEQIGRAARLSELEPKFCDVIVKRWQEFTGGTATLEGSGKSFSSILSKMEES